MRALDLANGSNKLRTYSVDFLGPVERYDAPHESGAERFAALFSTVTVVLHDRIGEQDMAEMIASSALAR